MIAVKTIPVGPWPMNAYVLVSSETGQSMLVDPGADLDRLLAELEGTQPQAILLTHSHPDHVGALAVAKEQLGVPVLAYGSPRVDALGVGVDTVLRDGDTVSLGNDRLLVYYAPGHIDDQICFRVVGGAAAIVGDTIFAGGPGKTWSAEGFQTTLVTLRDVVLGWPDDTACYPGHGESFRLGDLRPQIEAFVRHDHGDFFGDATWDMAAV